MSSGGLGGGGIIIIHPNVVTLPPLKLATSDLQGWADSMDESDPRKAAINDYLAAIPSE